MTEATSQDTDESQAAIVRWLGSPAAYEHAAAGVQMIETHISYVFLAGAYVYKLKKSVKFDFLDFSTPALREAACREEVRLNRRLAPHAYLGVVAVTREKNNGFCLNGGGEVVDWLVAMRRLPIDMTVDVLHQKGQLRDAHIDALAETLTAFYEKAARANIPPQEYRERYFARVQSNYRDLRAARDLTRAVVQRAHAFQLQLLRLCPQLFDQRIETGRIVDGHGDLRPEHVCLCDPIAVFDCVEFSANLRQVDVADDLAFFASECDYIGAGWAGNRLLSNYVDKFGDAVPTMLLDFYKAYRACVRAKVALLRSQQLEELHSLQPLAEAVAHLALADGYASEHIKPITLLVGGLSGTGKTTLARILADEFAAELLRSDVLRADLFASAGDDRPSVDKYQPQARLLVYEEMLGRATDHLRERVSVVMDATFSKAEDVATAHELVKRFHGQFLAVECRCSAKVARHRIEQRLKSKRDESEASLEVYAAQQKHWQPWPASIPQCVVDTEQPLIRQVEQVIAALRKFAGDASGPAHAAKSH